MARRRWSVMLLPLLLGLASLLLLWLPRPGVMPARSALFTSFIAEFTDRKDPTLQASLGLGSMRLLQERAALLAQNLDPCRAQVGLHESILYRFDVKVEPKAKGFRVVGILKGSENPALARCLRDRIEARTFAAWQGFTEARDEDYHLVIQIESNLAGEYPGALQGKGIY